MLPYWMCYFFRNGGNLVRNLGSYQISVCKKSPIEPNTVAEAIAGSNNDEWMNAMQEEFDTLTANGT